MGHRELFFAGSPLANDSTTCLSYSGCYEFPPPLPPAPPSWPQPPYAPPDGSRFTPAVIVVIALLGGVFLLVSYYFIIAKSCLIRRRRRSRARDHPPLDSGGGVGDGGSEEFVDENRVDHPIWYIRTVGLSPVAISSIAVCVYRKGEGLVEGSDCTVCLSEFSDGETLRVLPKCGHAFHLSCIDTWLRSHTNCPLCRAPIVSPIPLPLPPPERLSQRLDGDDNRAGGAVASRGENSNGAGAEEGVEPGESDGRGLSKEIDDANGPNGQLGVMVEEQEGAVVPARRSVSMDSPFLVIELPMRTSEANTSESRTIDDSSTDHANTSSHSAARSHSWSGRLFMPRHNSSSRTSSNSTLPR